MEKKMTEALDGLRSYAPVPWNMIPDFGLYMDQVITFISKMYSPLFGPKAEAYISPSMINNYVKARLIPRPAGKKYSREQIALLAMIVTLKQVTSMEDIRSMLCRGQSIGIERLYTCFCSRQLAALNELTSQVSLDSELPQAMDFAVTASAYRSGCEFLLKAEDR